jgi:hypothetical protein
MVTAIGPNASLKPSNGEPSSTDKMLGLVQDALAKHGVQWAETIRLAEDLPVVPLQQATDMLAANAAHLARLLKVDTYPRLPKE